jgi:hypothetical protein
VGLEAPRKGEARPTSRAMLGASSVGMAWPKTI